MLLARSHLRPFLILDCVVFSCVVFSCVVLSAAILLAEDLPNKVTFEEHIKPIFREHCSSCHNSNEKKSGLSLDNFTSTMAGGSGGELLVAGDLESSRLWALATHTEQPKMPPNQDKISDAKLALIKRWIQQGMPENDGSEIMAPKVDLSAMGTVSQSRPEGKPPMPESTLKQTPLHTQRAAAIAAMAASPWSPLIAIGGQEQIVLYHSETGELLGILPFPEGEPQSITFSRDGKLILVGGGRHSHSGYAVLYEIQTGKRITRVGDELDIVMAADLSEDNTKIALGGPQKLLRIYETATGQLLHELKKHTDWIYAVRFSPDGLLVASADRSNGLFVWESESGKFFLDLLGHKNEVRSVAWRPDSMALVSASLDGTLKLWDMNEGKVIKSWDAHGGGAFAVAICNDGTIASTGKDRKVKLWDAGGNASGEMPNLNEVGMEVAISVDSKNVAAGDWDGNVRLWEKANPKNERQLRANPLPLQQAIVEAEKLLPSRVAILAGEEQKWKELDAKVAAAKTAFAESETNVAATKAMLDAKQNEANAATKAKESADLALKTALAKIETDRKTVSDLTSQLAVLKSKEQETAAVETELGAIQKSIDDQDKQIAEFRKSATENNSLLAVIQSKLNELPALKAKFDKAREVANASLQEVAKDLPAAKAKFDEATNSVAHQHASIENLRKDLESFTKAMQQWTVRLAEIGKQAASIEQQRIAAQSGMDAEESNRNVTLEKLDSIKKQLEKLQQSVAQFEKDKTRCEQVIAEKKTTIENVSIQLGQFKSEQQSLTEQLQIYSR